MLQKSQEGPDEGMGFDFKAGRSQMLLRAHTAGFGLKKNNTDFVIDQMLRGLVWGVSANLAV